jgi:hypothetical protein
MSIGSVQITLPRQMRTSQLTSSPSRKAVRSPVEKLLPAHGALQESSAARSGSGYGGLHRIYVGPGNATRPSHGTQRKWASASHSGAAAGAVAPSESAEGLVTTRSSRRGGADDEPDQPRRQDGERRDDEDEQGRCSAARRAAPGTDGLYRRTWLVIRIGLRHGASTRCRLHRSDRSGGGLSCALGGSHGPHRQCEARPHLRERG